MSLSEWTHPNSTLSSPAPFHHWLRNGKLEALFPDPTSKAQTVFSAAPDTTRLQFLLIDITIDITLFPIPTGLLTSLDLVYKQSSASGPWKSLSPSDMIVVDYLFTVLLLFSHGACPRLPQTKLSLMTPLWEHHVSPTAAPHSSSAFYPMCTSSITW